MSTTNRKLRCQVGSQRSMATSPAQSSHSGRILNLTPPHPTQHTQLNSPLFLLLFLFTWSLPFFFFACFNSFLVIKALGLEFGRSFWTEHPKLYTSDNRIIRHICEREFFSKGICDLEFGCLKWMINYKIYMFERSMILELLFSISILV